MFIAINQGFYSVLDISVNEEYMTANMSPLDKTIIVRSRDASVKP